MDGRKWGPSEDFVVYDLSRRRTLPPVGMQLVDLFPHRLEAEFQPRICDEKRFNRQPIPLAAVEGLRRMGSITQTLATPTAR